MSRGILAGAIAMDEGDYLPRALALPIPRGRGKVLKEQNTEWTQAGPSPSAALESYLTLLEGIDQHAPATRRYLMSAPI